MNVPTTIEELIEYPDRAEKLSDDQLMAILRPHFPHTRPANMPSASDARLKKMESAMPSDDELLAMARANKAKRLAAQNQSTNEQPTNIRIRPGDYSGRTDPLPQRIVA